MTNKQLVTRLKDQGAITRKDVENAFLAADRALFVPREFQAHAYEDHPLAIGNGQTISQPSLVAQMIELADARAGQNILEIGTGSGWKTALLAEIVGKQGKIYSVEYDRDLHEQAKHRFAKYDNVLLFLGDGSLGWPKHAPYDRIIAKCACPAIPKPWIEQLRTGGKILAPVGPRDIQSLALIEKTKHGVKQKDLRISVVFVPLRGKHGW